MTNRKSTKAKLAAKEELLAALAGTPLLGPQPVLPPGVGTTANAEKGSKKKKKVPVLEVTSVPEASPYLRMLIFGSTGAGKTYLCGTLCDLPEGALKGPILYLAIEAGLTTIRERDVEVNKVKGTLTPEKVVTILEHDPTRWSVVVLDSLTGYYKMLLKAIMKSDTRPGKDALVPEQRDYQKARIVMDQQVFRLSGLPCHFIATALPSTKQDQLTGAIYTLPSLAGKLEHEIGAHFDVIMHLSVRVKGEGRERVGIVQPGRRIQAKDRFSALGSQVVNPTMPGLWEAIFGVVDSR